MKYSLLAAILLCSAPVRGAEIDRKVLFKHIHQTFNTPADLKFELKDLKPSAIPGFMTGRLELGDGPQQVQTIQISNDGRFYFLASAFQFVASPVPGLRTLKPEPDQPPPPPVYLSQDGQYALLGAPMDLSIEPDSDNLKKIKLKGVPGWGPAGASVLLAEYSDHQCPHCKRAHESLERELPAAYAGKVRWVFKNYPLTNLHPWSYSAALAQACAVMIKPEAARELSASFFREQESITKETVRAKSLEFAKKYGIDGARFEGCLDRQESKPSVEADIAEGNALGVNGTPTIFINGRRARSYDFHELKSVIEEMLAGKKH